MSLVLIGLCHGYTTNVKTFGENSFTDHLILVEVEQTSQYGTAEVKTIPVKISKRLMDQGIQHVWNQYKGKPVSVPVFVAPWASKAGNAGFDFQLAADGKPVNVQLAPPAVKAAS